MQELGYRRGDNGEVQENVPHAVGSEGVVSLNVTGMFTSLYYFIHSSGIQ